MNHYITSKLSKLLRFAFGKKPIGAFDAITRSTLERGCSSAERSAILLYGTEWRKKYKVQRLMERKIAFPLSDKICPFFEFPPEQHSGKEASKHVLDADKKE